MINNVINILNIIVVVMVVAIAAIVAGVLIYKRRAKRALNNDDDFREIPCLDSVKCVPFEDIADDMIIDKGRKRFSAVLVCSGFDFYNANVDEKVRKQSGYINFFRALDDDISYRQYSEDINLDYTIEKYEKAYEKLQKELYFLKESYVQVRQGYDESMAAGKTVDDSVEDYLLSAQRKMQAYDWRLYHMETELDYLRAKSSPAAGMRKIIQTYVVSWVQPTGLFIKNITEKELQEKAGVELNKICRQKIRQLSESGVMAKRAGTNELIDMCRKHFHPYNGNLFPMSEIVNSSFYDDVVTTDSFDNLNKELDKELVEDFLLGGY